MAQLWQRREDRAFPEAFIPGTPIWIDSRPIWDEDWDPMLVDQAVVPGPVTEALGTAARAVSAYVVIGVQSRGLDIWAAPTLGSQRRLDRGHATHRLEGRCYVIGVNPCLHVDQIPTDFPHRERLWAQPMTAMRLGGAGNSVIINPSGRILAGPARHEETILYADVDLAAVHAARQTSSTR